MINDEICENTRFDDQIFITGMCFFQNQHGNANREEVVSKSSKEVKLIPKEVVAVDERRSLV